MSSKAIGESLPDVSANIFLRQFPGGPFQLTASRGRCTKTGRHLLPKSENLQQPFLSSSVSDVDSSGLRSIGVPFCSNKQLLGLIYLEKRGETISEEEIDFLACVRSIAEIQLGGQLPSNLKRKGKLHPLILHSGSQIVGEHTRMQRLFEEIRQVAPTEATVLICGESGTGKELVARAVHDNSSRHSGPFVPVNCSALPNELVENELFGHSRGSFTGATGGKPGLFEVASGGTLFLDEIGTMPLDLQSRLLRVLEDKHIRRLGETSERRVDARVVAATNQPLKKRVRQGKFREDLYHRLNVYQLEIPPLRERPSDIALLSDHFLQGVNQREGRESRLSPQAVTLLTEYPFPGNVRELKNVVESVYYLSQGKTITAEEVSARFSSSILSVEKLAPSCAELIVEDLVAGRAEFWQAVRDPFLKRDLSRGEVRKIMSIGLSACGGTYRRLVEYFHLPANDYRKLLAFLSNHACKVDFRPFRKKTAG